MKTRIITLMLLILTLLPYQSAQANSSGTTIYIPVVTTGNSEQHRTDSPVSLAPAIGNASLSPAAPNYALYLPIVSVSANRSPSEQADEVNAALWGWPWWPTPTADDEFSLKIEKRDFDAGGDAAQTNLLLIPGIIDLLEYLLLSPELGRKVWGFENARFDDAQALSSGNRVTVAVIDTGISLLSSELYFRTVSGYDFVERDYFPYESANLRDDDHDGQTDEGVGHGTFVSSIVTVATRRARIMPIRVLNSDGNGTPENVAKGIRYAADKGANIINLSLSSNTDDSIVRSAIDYAVGKGVVIIAAALSNSDSVGFPAGYPGVISVGSIDRSNTLPSYVLPNAAAIDVFAPGVDIYGPSYWGNDVWMSGNSMAAAFVSAAAALLMENGTCNAECVRGTLTSRVKEVSPSQGNRGSIDVYAALRNRP